jgi:hypothetical protein
MGPDDYEEREDDEPEEMIVIENRIDEDDLTDLEEDQMEDLEDEAFDLDF